MAIKVEQATVKIWGFLISAIAVIMALGYLQIFPILITAGIANAAILFLLGITIISEVAFADSKDKFQDKFNLFAVFVGAIAILIAVVFASQWTIPAALSGLVGALYLITAAFTVLTVFTEQ